jgi:hypothetical protein
MTEDATASTHPASTVQQEADNFDTVVRDGMRIAGRMMETHAGTFFELAVTPLGEAGPHLFIMPACRHSMNPQPIPPPEVVVDGVRYVPAPPEGTVC